MIDLVDEHNARQADFIEPLENELQGRNLFLVRLAHHHRHIAADQRSTYVLVEFNGARAIEECVALTQVVRRGHIELNAHAVTARFR